MRAVLDTNVLLAAFLADGVCARILRRARSGQFDLVLSPFILGEFSRVLTRKFRATGEEVSSALSLVADATAGLVRPEPPFPDACRDKPDNQVLACAREAGAAFLVTGDEDLLVLSRFGRTIILSPRDFEARMEG